VIALGERIYDFVPGLRLAIRGDRGSLRHFDLEYGRRMAAHPGPADVVITFSDGLGQRKGISGGHVAGGGHKSVGWEVNLGDPDSRPLSAEISLRGWPRSFGLSLVQGYLVEGLVSIAAVRSGHVLLPAAAVVVHDEAVLILGPSGAGKSSVTARALAAGRAVIGDDQVIIDSDARCTSFPRRMRLYPDLARTAPAAFDALTRRTSLQLQVRELVDGVTRGFVRPSLAVDASEVSPSYELRSAAIGRVLVLEPRAAVPDLQVVAEDLDLVLEAAGRISQAQRARLWSVSPGEWRTLINETLVAERAILSSAFAAPRLDHVRLPNAWPAERCIEALEALVDLRVPATTLIRLA
jgi:hypothetical protein